MRHVQIGISRLIMNVRHRQRMIKELVRAIKLAAGQSVHPKMLEENLGGGGGHGSLPPCF